MTYQPDDRDAFLSQPRIAVLATAGNGGRIHAVPVWYRWDGDVFRIITERGSVKHRNAVRAGRATLCIDERDGPYRYVTAEGPVTVADPVTYEERLALHTVYRGAEAAKAAVDRGGHERMVLLLLRPERWTS
ncbi:MAG: PPOX class F420-dependent oxidoreductase [Dehalococcoidia bacterium]